MEQLPALSTSSTIPRRRSREEPSNLNLEKNYILPCCIFLECACFMLILSNDFHLKLKLLFPIVSVCIICILGVKWFFVKMKNGRYFYFPLQVLCLCKTCELLLVLKGEIFYILACYLFSVGVELKSYSSPNLS